MLTKNTFCLKSHLHVMPKTMKWLKIFWRAFEKLSISVKGFSIAMIKSHQQSGLSQQKFILSLFWSPEVWPRGLGGAMLPAKPLGENLSSPLPVTWFTDAYLCSSAVPWASPLWYLCVYCPHLIRTLCLDVEPTLNPGWFCLESLNFLQRPYFLVHFPSDVNFGEHYSYVIHS